MYGKKPAKKAKGYAKKAAQKNTVQGSMNYKKKKKY